MKTSHHPQAAVALILAATLYAFTPSLGAQSGDSAQQPGAQQQTQPQNKTFTGKVLKLEGGQYALVTGQTPEGKLAGHFLDNADQAKNYEGKQVTVTGTLDVASNTIHVTNIQAA